MSETLDSQPFSKNVFKNNNDLFPSKTKMYKVVEAAQNDGIIFQDKAGANKFFKYLEKKSMNFLDENGHPAFFSGCDFFLEYGVENAAQLFVNIANGQTVDGKSRFIAGKMFLEASKKYSIKFKDIKNAISSRLRKKFTNKKHLKHFLTHFMREDILIIILYLIS